MAVMEWKSIIVQPPDCQRWLKHWISKVHIPSCDLQRLQLLVSPDDPICSLLQHFFFSCHWQRCDPSDRSCGHIVHPLRGCDTLRVAINIGKEDREKKTGRQMGEKVKESFFD